MFDFIRKPRLWDLWSRKLDTEIGKHAEFHLKSIQDLAVYALLRDVEGKSIGEIGGGNSRVLPRLAERNVCYNIEPFEGKDGGPNKIARLPRVTNLPTYVGVSAATIEDSFFDILFSISVLEHIPNDKLSDFVRDSWRILKPNGWFVHAIDIYVDDSPSDYFRQRYDFYRSLVDGSELFSPREAVFRGPLAFTCDMASNPDHTMYAWGRLAPELNDLRQRAQCVSLLVSGSKIQST
jgi:SAM-dependent methyltransferase